LQKVVHLSLRGIAYSIEEAGYEPLRRYLEAAATNLAADPDRDEIVGDLEQAIGEKFARHLGPHKSVVSAAEVAQVLSEMGPVGAAEPATQGAADAQAGPPPAADGASSAGPSAAPAAAPPRRLYRVLEGGVLGGLCAGMGAYLGVDANVLRVGFVVLALLTHGAFALVYLILLFVVPAAGTAEERAAARGLPFSAQALVDQAKRQYARIEREVRSEWANGLKEDARWERRARRRAWREARREWREAWWGAGPGGGTAPPASYARQVAAGVAIPVLALLSAGLTVAFVVVSAMLITTGQIMGWTPGLPLWAGLLALLMVVGAVGQPFHHARRALQRDARGGGLLAAWDGLLWLGFLALFAWLAWASFPEVRDLLHDLPGAAARLKASLHGS
jgi:phage shock protein PspC (stress-responsive transcriptional regulator)